MNKLSRSIMLAASAMVVSVIGFTVDAASRPDPLQANANCGAFNGKMCAANCTERCGEGCCGWAFYYYLDHTTVLPPP